MTQILSTRSVAVAALALLGAACGGSQKPSTDAASSDASDDVNHCANAGCGAAPVCGMACGSPCGCCGCTPGERNGDLVCTSAGCYGTPLQTDAAVDSTWTPAPACALPFDPGPCKAAVTVYAFVGGACIPQIYGGCQGNNNRFSTLEECLAACEGQPDPYGCEGGRITRQICLACGAAGGCAVSATVCANPCDPNNASAFCDAPLPFCSDGVCQVASCI